MFNFVCVFLFACAWFCPTLTRHEDRLCMSKIQKKKLWVSFVFLLVSLVFWLVSCVFFIWVFVFFFARVLWMFCCLCSARGASNQIGAESMASGRTRIAQNECGTKLEFWILPLSLSRFLPLSGACALRSKNSIWTSMYCAKWECYRKNSVVALSLSLAVSLCCSGSLTFSGACARRSRNSSDKGMHCAKYTSRVNRLLKSPPERRLCVFKGIVCV